MTQFKDLPTVIDSYGVEYREYNGLFFHANTPEVLAKVISKLHHTQQRVAVIYGDTSTGKAWSDIDCGRIGRSTGRIKIPLSIHNSRSMGGPALGDNCIVKIMLSSAPHTVLYQHPTFTPPTDTHHHIIWQIQKYKE